MHSSVDTDMYTARTRFCSQGGCNFQKFFDRCPLTSCTGAALTDWSGCTGVENVEAPCFQVTARYRVRKKYVAFNLTVTTSTVAATLKI